MATPGWWVRVLRRLRALLRTREVDGELDEEIRHHLELETDELMRSRGLSRAEAARRARVAFGGVERYREAHRDARGVTWIEHRLQDLRYALRGIRHHPGFAAAVVVTLALGIGANTAMFSIVDRLLFRPPPLIRHPALVHRIYLAETWKGKEYAHAYFPYARYADLVRDSRSFARTAMVTERDLAVGTGTDAREMKVAVVTGQFFAFFDARPVAGRFFTPAEDTPPRGAAVVVLSYGFWQAAYGGRIDVLGETVQVGPTPYTIIGVAPPGFVGLWPDAPPAVYLPLTVVGAERQADFRATGEDWWSTYHWQWTQMIAERRPGVSVAQAEGDLTQAARRSYAAQAAAEQGRAGAEELRPRAIVASVLSDRGPNTSSLARVAAWISGVALIVWLIACANVANLFLARAMQRRREIAVRLALGVSRSRLAAQLLTESVLLAAIGGLCGVAVAQWGGAVLRGAFLSRAAAGDVVGDSRTLLYAGLAALVAGILTGLAPLLQAGRANLNRDLRAGAREGTYQRSRLRAGLLVFQGTLSVVLLVGAGLFVRSLSHVRAVPLGFQPDRVMLVTRNMRGVPLDSAASVALVEQLRRAALALPGVEQATRQVTTPFYQMWDLRLVVPGADSARAEGQFELDAVSPEYFATMGTRILRGRGISAADVAGAPPVMVVSQAMAQRLWPGQNPLGRCVKLDSDTMPCHSVVGVAENIKAEALSDEDGLYYYLSAAQFHPDQGGLFVRAQGDPGTLREALRRRLQRLMPGAAYVTVTPLREFIARQAQPWRVGATMFVIFGLLALSLAAIGLYSVIAFNVGQRRHELGVRVALGATMGDIVREVMTGGVRLALAGVALGVVTALLVGRWVEPLLFEESPRDPAVLGLVALVLLLVAALASFLPARRAARVDPMRALRTD